MFRSCERGPEVLERLQRRLEDGVPRVLIRTRSVALLPTFTKKSWVEPA